MSNYKCIVKLKMDQKQKAIDILTALGAVGSVTGRSLEDFFKYFDDTVGDADLVVYLRDDNKVSWEFEWDRYPSDVDENYPFVITINNPKPKKEVVLDGHTYVLKEIL